VNLRQSSPALISLHAIPLLCGGAQDVTELSGEAVILRKPSETCTTIHRPAAASSEQGHRCEQ
jgi:hypothetical protein